jgi:hypothetical protein
MMESAKRYAWRQWRSLSRGRPGERLPGSLPSAPGTRPRALGRAPELQPHPRHPDLAVSAVGALLPGPGRGTAIIGFALIAGEFLPAARLLDWAELRLRHFWQFVRDIWGHSWAGKGLVVIVTALILFVLGCAVYALVFAG